MAAATGRRADSPPSNLAMALRMARRFRPYRGQVFWSLLAAFLGVGMNLVAPLLLREIIDTALPHRDIGLLAVLCTLMIVAGALGSLLAIIQTALANRVGQQVIVRLRTELYDRARAQPLEFYSERSGSETQARLVSDVEGVDRFLTNIAQSTLVSITGMVTAMIAMFILSPSLAVASIVLAVLLGLLNNRFAARRRRLAGERQRHIGEVLRLVGEDLSLPGVILGRTLGRTGHRRERFAQVCRDIGDTAYRQRMAGAVALTIIGAAFAAIPPLIYFVAGTMLTGITVGTVIVLAILQMRLSGPIQGILQLSSSVQMSFAMFERIIEYLDLPMSEPDGKRTAPLAPLPMSLHLRDISVRYRTAARPALSDAGLDVPAGSLTVIVGRSGSGKSTLGLVMAGLLPPATGAVYVDGRGVAEPDRLRDLVTLVPQQPFLYAGTIRTNLASARDDVTATELARVTRIARLDDLISALPDGLDTPIGADGHQLSGGERQRVALARALLTDCRMIILDEATSALDAATAHQVHEELRAYCQDRTLVVITHHVPEMRPDDRVAVLDRGHIVEHDTHAALSRGDGGYARMLATQLHARERKESRA